MPAKKSVFLLNQAKKHKLSIVLSVLLVVLSLQLKPALAQQTQTPVEKAKSDYNFQIAKYNDSHESYITAKESYLSFKTAVAKTNAFTQTKTYLGQTGQLYLSFFSLLQEHVNSIKWTNLSSFNQDASNILNEESAYFREFNQRVESTKTLEELPPLADELQAHIRNDTEPKMNKVLAILEIGQTDASLSEFNTLSNILDRIVLFKLRSGEAQSVLANWSSEIKSIRDITQSNIDKAKEEIAARPQTTYTKGDLDRVTDQTTAAKEELKRSEPLLREAARII